MGATRRVYKMSIGRPEGKRPFGRTGVNGRIILKWILWKSLGGYGSDLSASR
jgi:hypothetical protein